MGVLGACQAENTASDAGSTAATTEAANSTEVDVVSGASTSSRALMAAVEDAKVQWTK